MKNISYFFLGIFVLALSWFLFFGATDSQPYRPASSKTQDYASKSTNKDTDEWNAVIICAKLRNQGQKNAAWRECMITSASKIKSWEHATTFVISAAAWLEQVPEDIEIKKIARDSIKRAWADLDARKGDPNQAWFLDQAELMIEAPELYKTQSERRLRMFPQPSKIWRI